MVKNKIFLIILLNIAVNGFSQTIFNNELLFNTDIYNIDKVIFLKSELQQSEIHKIIVVKNKLEDNIFFADTVYIAEIDKKGSIIKEQLLEKNSITVIYYVYNNNLLVSSRKINIKEGDTSKIELYYDYRKRVIKEIYQLDTVNIEYSTDTIEYVYHIKNGKKIIRNKRIYDNHGNILNAIKYYPSINDSIVTIYKYDENNNILIEKRIVSDKLIKSDFYIYEKDYPFTTQYQYEYDTLKRVTTIITKSSLYSVPQIENFSYNDFGFIAKNKNIKALKLDYRLKKMRFKIIYDDNIVYTYFDEESNLPIRVDFYNQTSHIHYNITYIK